MKNSHSSLSASENHQNHTDSLVDLIKSWGQELGFADVGISNTDLSAYEAEYFNWIGENFHGDMDYMQRHGTKRTRPAELEPGTTSIISVRMNYFDQKADLATEQLHQDQKAYISRYALGKDYHKLMRKRLQLLASKIAEQVEGFQYRAFCDSAPVLERPIAEKAGLGFIGKNSLIIHPRAGSWFFLGELYTNLVLPADATPHKQGCGPCSACIQECPTQAIVDNAIVDSRRCISYLTIEYQGSIDPELRPLMGNRIYGCDDCQLVCPWNKFTEPTNEQAFQPNQNSLDNIDLVELWSWNEQQFLNKLQGSPIRRIGYAQWVRNLAIALGNIAIENEQQRQILIKSLQQKVSSINALVDEHIEWAIQQLTDKPIKTTAADQQTNAQPLKPFIAKKYYLPK